MTTLKRIEVLSLARALGGVMALAGLLAGVLYSGIGLVIDLMTIGWNAGTALAFLALPGMPAIFAVAGFLAGGLLASFFNIAAGRLGGIRVDVGE